jgi:hypothetical protein
MSRFRRNYVEFDETRARGAATRRLTCRPRDRWDRLCPALDQCNLASYAAAVDDSAVNGAAWSGRLYGKVALVCQSGGHVSAGA